MENILILGAKGMLGGQLMKVFPGALGWDRADSKIDPIRFSGQALENFKNDLKSLDITAIINCIAYNDVDGAEENKEVAFAFNANLPRALASVCKDLDIPFVHFSTNYVFDSDKGEYQESDEPCPSSVYSQSKYQGEQELQKKTDKFYLVRTALLFGPKGESEASKKSFVDLMLQLSEKSATIKAVNNEINSLTFVKDLAERVKYLLDTKQPYGIYHITNEGCASWYEFAKEIFSITGRKIELIPVSSSEFPRKAKRPQKSVLLNTKLPQMRPWQEALREFLSTR